MVKETALPFAAVAVIVECSVSPFSSVTTVASFGTPTPIDFAAFNFHIPTNGSAANSVVASAKSPARQIAFRIVFN